MLIWLASYPRSGNGFLRLTLHRYFRCQSAAKHAPRSPQGRSTGAMPYAIKLPGTLAEAAASSQLYFVKTHDRVEADDSPAIYIYRDGRASLATAWARLAACADRWK